MTQVYVGATNVGSMTLNHEPEFITNDSDVSERIQKLRYKDEIVLEPGQEVGMFKLGSTVVMIFEAPKNMIWNIKEGDSVKYGQVIAEIPKIKK